MPAHQGGGGRGGPRDRPGALWLEHPVCPGPRRHRPRLAAGISLGREPVFGTGTSGRGRGIRDLVGELVEEGMSKFVVGRATPVASWPDELDWLADAVLDLQT